MRFLPAIAAAPILIVLLTVSLIISSVHESKTRSKLLRATNHKIEGYDKGNEGHWNGPYRFVFGTDPQPGLIDRIQGGNGTKWAEEIRLLKKGIAEINEMKPAPRFFFIGGDIVDAWPDEEPYRTQQTQDVLEALADCEVPIMVIGGNHDFGNVPTKATIAVFQRLYGDDYYSFFVGGVMYIALNSQLFFNSTEVPELAEEQMDWLGQTLQEAKADQDLKHVVLLMHIPLFTSSGDEDDSYFNIPLPLRMTLLENFGEAGIKLVFSGHYHRNAGGIWTKTISGESLRVESLVVSAIGAQLGDDKSGMNLVSVEENDIAHKYYSIDA